MQTTAGEPSLASSTGTDMTGSNPYEAPRAAVGDYEPVRADAGDFLGAPRVQPIGNGATWLGDAWQLFRQNIGLWIGIFVVMVVLMMMVNLVPVLGGFLYSLLFPVFTAGLMLGCDALRRGEPLEFAHLFAGFNRNTGQLFLAGGLYTLGSIVAMMAALLPLMGFAGATALLGIGEFPADTDMMLMLIAILLLLALTLPLLMAIWFAPALIMLDGKPAIEAMKLSFVGCLKNILPFLLYGVIGLLIAVAASLPLFLGWLIAGPWLYVSCYTAYRDIFYAD